MKKLFSLFAALTLSVGLWAINGVKYIDAKGKEQTANNVTEITNASATLNAGWYIVLGKDVKIGMLTCSGDVHLILGDDAQLTVMNNGKSTPGIKVPEGNNFLTIYGQTAQSGQLKAFGGEQCAAIGEGYTKTGNNITINGGIVTATGGNRAAGIGGGDGGFGKNITINGGTVTATGGKNGAGIGSGCTGYSIIDVDGVNITINGGKITANGGLYAAGIGGGNGGNGRNITINGGIITANGGESGAGIGGGSHGEGIDITITGGVITATGGTGTENGSGIGHGNAGGAGKNIKVVTSLVIRADGINPPFTVIDNDGNDLNMKLSGKQFVTVRAAALAVGDQFEDEASGLKFEVTAVGKTNTVMVIPNKYKGTSYSIPSTVTYYDDVTYNVTKIGEEAFFNCKTLASITLPKSITTIEESAFQVCSSLRSITIPAGVTMIEQYAFALCTILTSVTFDGNACQKGIIEDAFYDVGKTTPATLVLPDNWTGSKPVNNKTSWYGGYFNYGAPSALPTINANVKVNKFLYNGQVIFRQGEKNYTITGQKVK